MIADPFNLEGLLNPVSTDRFFSEYWEQRRLHLARKADTQTRAKLMGAPPNAPRLTGA
jgi:hypothetical protein